MTIIPSIIHWILAYTLAVNYDMKILGVAIASSIHFLCRFLVILSCVHYDQDLRKGLIPIFHEDSWKSLGHIVKTGWNSFLLTVMGWWAFDVFTQLAAIPGDKNITAAQTILRIVGLYTFMFPVGIGYSARFFVGSYMGKQNPKLAKQYGNLA